MWVLTLFCSFDCPSTRSSSCLSSTARTKVEELTHFLKNLFWLNSSSYLKMSVASFNWVWRAVRTCLTFLLRMFSVFIPSFLPLFIIVDVLFCFLLILMNCDSTFDEPWINSVFWLFWNPWIFVLKVEYLLLGKRWRGRDDEWAMVVVIWLRQWTWYF